MKPRAIFHLDGEAGFRGGERQALYLAAALRARGVNNVVYARSGSEFAAEAARQGFEVRTVPYWGEWDPVSAWSLASAARREKALLHAHTAHAAGTAALATMFGAKTVAHRRVDFAVSGVSGRLKYGRAGKVICVSKAIADLMTSAGVANERITVIPDGIPATPEEARWASVEAKQFDEPTANEKNGYRKRLSDELGVQTEKIWIGNLAALVPHKDHDTLLAAAVIVLLKRPNARFLIAGRGPEEARLFESIKRMGLLGKVLLLGHRADPLPVLKALDLYCQSSWGEGMGSVLIEAAACGVPVVATTAGGIPEVVENHETGLLVEPRRPEALADALIRLIDDRALAGRLAAEGRRRLSRFGLTRMAAKMEEVYDSVA